MQKHQILAATLLTRRPQGGLSRVNQRLGGDLPQSLPCFYKSRAAGLLKIPGRLKQKKNNNNKIEETLSIEGNSLVYICC